MNPIEFKARREALGLSQSELARLLDVKQVTISAWENGTRSIPVGAEVQLEDIEEVMEDLVGEILESREAGVGDMPLMTYASNAALDVGAPHLAGLPAAMHRVACARAAVLLREDGLHLGIQQAP